jgi:inorganic triphosphatase YgiF
VEVELKFQIPPARRAALRDAVKGASAQATRLRAVYFDTPDRALAAAGLALRLRDEGGQWVQTLKGRGDGVAGRLEHEVPVGAAAVRAVPALDVARHAGHAAGAALRRALRAGGGAGALAERFRTDIRRTHRRVRSGGALIEIALDEGRLEAGAARLPVHEIEFELISGPPAALAALAARWVARFGLWWDVRTKAERGERLARALDRVPATRAAAPAVHPRATPADAFAAVLHAGLAQVLPNAAEIGEGLDAPEHLHQLRVGLRRLRTALRDFAAWSPDPDAARALEAAWREPFARLGAARDLDVVLQTLWPRMQAAGAPALPVIAPEARQDGPRAEVTAPAFQQLLLDTLALARAPQPARDGDGALRPATARVLRRAWRRALEGAAGFEQLGVAEQHTVRKRLKRLRYGFEFVAALYPAAAARRLQRCVAEAGETLGELNDLAMAETVFDPGRDAPRDTWALGWLAAERERTVARAGKRLRALAAMRPPWR